MGNTMAVAGNDAVRFLKKQWSINMATLTGHTTGSEVNCSDAGNSVEFCIPTGTLAVADGSNYMTLTVLQATTSGGSFSAADAGQYDFVNSWDGKIDSQTTDSNTFRSLNFLLKPGYPYLKAYLAETGTFNDILGVFVQFIPGSQPAIAT